MSAIIPLSSALGIDTKKLSWEETTYLEADLLLRLCEYLISMFKTKYGNYLTLIKYTMEMQENMFETNLVKLIVKDILVSEEYSLAGIAYYTQTPEEVIYEIVAGSNTRPSAHFLRKLIELHRQVKLDLYLEIKKKILLDYSSAA